MVMQHSINYPVVQYLAFKSSINLWIYPHILIFSTLVIWHTKAWMLHTTSTDLVGSCLACDARSHLHLTFWSNFYFMVKHFYNYYCLFRDRPTKLKTQTKTKQNTFASDLCQLSNNTWHLIFLMSYVLYYSITCCFFFFQIQN